MEGKKSTFQQRRKCKCYVNDRIECAVRPDFRDQAVVPFFFSTVSLVIHSGWKIPIYSCINVQYSKKICVFSKAVVYSIWTTRHLHWNYRDRYRIGSWIWINVTSVSTEWIYPLFPRDSLSRCIYRTKLPFVPNEDSTSEYIHVYTKGLLYDLASKLWDRANKAIHLPTGIAILRWQGITT